MAVPYVVGGKGEKERQSRNAGLSYLGPNTAPR